MQKKYIYRKVILITSSITWPLWILHVNPVLQLWPENHLRVQKVHVVMCLYDIPHNYKINICCSGYFLKFFLLALSSIRVVLFSHKQKIVIGKSSNYSSTTILNNATLTVTFIFCPEVECYYDRYVR